MLEKLKKRVDQMLAEDSSDPWLKEQSIQSIASYSVEEIYELVDAIEREDQTEICAELADLCYHLCIYLSRVEQNGWADAARIEQLALAKIEQRSATQAMTAEEAHQHWQARKQQMNASSILANIPLNTPALVQSQQIQKATAQVNFDWETREQVVEVLQSEIAELTAEFEENDKARLQDELGDVLFTCVNLAKHLGIDAEQALRQANRKFTRRFNTVEKHAEQEGIDLRETPFEQLLEIWALAKQNDRVP